MSDMLARASDALRNLGIAATWEASARHALLAALDPEDEALVEELARRMNDEDFYRVDPSACRAMAYAALVELKAMAQGETRP